MKCTITENGEQTRLEVEGALDAMTAPEIRPIFDKVVTDRRRHVTVDIARVTMIDSSGIGAIVSLFKRVKADGGQVLVVGARDQPLAVLKLLKLDRVFGL
jgi:anti-sigma B factor antagonist